MIPKLKVFRNYTTWRKTALRHGPVHGDNHWAVAQGNQGTGVGDWDGKTGWLSGYLVGVSKAAHRLLTGYTR